MPKKEVRNIEEARLVLKKNLGEEKLNALAQEVDEESLSLLVSAAISLSWEIKDSKLSTFAIQNKK